MNASNMKGGRTVPFNTNGQVFGTSRYLGPADGERLVAEAELMDFAPCPYVCCICFVPDKARYRTYIRAYENRIETNWPIFPCLCCTDERCMIDNTRVFFYDKPPSRAGTCCVCVPNICCGPPVLYDHIPKLWGCIDLRPCCGETIRYSPCNLGNKGDDFLSKWKGALEAYRIRNELPKSQRARFVRVSDRICDCDAVRKIEATPWPAPQAQVMEDRGGGGGTNGAATPDASPPDSPARTAHSHDSSPPTSPDYNPSKGL